MPQVGNIKFPYTEEGEQQAEEYAQVTNQEVKPQSTFGYARGGSVGEYMEERAKDSTLKKLLTGRSVPLSKKLYEKSFDESERMY